MVIINNNIIIVRFLNVNDVDEQNSVDFVQCKGGEGIFARST